MRFDLTVEVSVSGAEVGASALDPRTSQNYQTYDCEREKNASKKTTVNYLFCST